MVPAAEEAQIAKLLLKYKHAHATKKEICDVVENYRSLSYSLQKFVFNDGSSKDLFNFRGTIPVVYKNITYYIPISIWLMDTHPMNAPICYVKPTNNMLIKVSMYVDHNGRIYLPYLHDWQPHTSDLLSLIQVMIVTFGEHPPVYAKPKEQTAPYPTSSGGSGGSVGTQQISSTGGSCVPYPTGSVSGGAGATTTFPPYPPVTGGSYPPLPTPSGGNNFNNYPPLPPPTGGNSFSSYPPMPQPTGGTNFGSYPPIPPPGGNNFGSYPPMPQPTGGATTGAPNYPPYMNFPGTSGYNSGYNSSDITSTGTITEEHIKASLISAVEDKLRRRLQEKVNQCKAEIDTLNRTKQELIEGSTRIDTILNNLQKEESELLKNINILRDKEKELEESLKILENSDGIDPDEAVTTTAPLYKQLLNAYAEEAAVEDAIYYLGEALRSGVIDLETFVKHVRQLSRKQFMLRALMQKCRQKAGLVG